ncbi:MAG: RNA-guided endonuclease TnpB family protein [Sciscionella sp.]
MVRFEVPDGAVVQAYRFALDATSTQERAMASHVGAFRFARNHMLGLVKAVLEQRAAERSDGITEFDLTPGLGWSLPALRRAWNARKHLVAPWWRENSKEAYNTGLDSLARSLEAWSKCRRGERAGGGVGFPRFRSRRGKASVRFTTGTIRVEADRHHVTLPRLGTIRVHESTRKLARRVKAGTARVLSCTVARDSAGRWHVAFQTLVQRSMRRRDNVGTSGHPVVGVDVGVKDLLVVATGDGAKVERVRAPKSLTSAQARLRALQRKAARQQGPYDPTIKRKCQPSNRWRHTQAGIGKTHARAASVRRDALHKATTRLAKRHQIIIVETLNAYGSILVEADRWYPSSKTCSGCGSRKPRLLLSECTYVCEHCGLILGRDHNAAINLARLGETQRLGDQSPAGSGHVAGRGATRETDAAGDEASTPHQQPPDQTGTASPQGEDA